MIVDTWAWIELLKGSEIGKKVREFLLKEKCYTCITTFSEIVDWILKNNLKEKLDEYISNVKIASSTLDLNEDATILAGKLNYERKKIIKDWGMLDSFILASAMINNLKILTGDEHFKDLSNVTFL
jgi:predicted nucleic acid-binding protein